MTDPLKICDRSIENAIHTYIDEHRLWHDVLLSIQLICKRLEFMKYILINIYLKNKKYP